jgi:hypothetical protein
MPTICKEVQDWVEEQIEKPIDDWITKTEEQCSEYDWWNPAGWFCWLVTIVVRVVKIILVTVGKWVARIVCEVINFLVTIIAAVINLVLAIPIIGPIIKAIIRTITTVLSYVIGLVDGLGRLIGIRITKHLRVHVIPLCERTIPLAYESHLTAIMQQTSKTFYDRAQIRIHTTFHEPIRNPPENALRLGTAAELILDELWVKGTWHQIQTLKLFQSNLWSLLSIGHPVIVYVIREVGYDGPGTVVGTSAGPFTNWVAVERNSVVPQVVADAAGNPAQPLAPYPPTVASSAATSPVANPSYQRFVIAHEICHSLGLLGHANSNPGELMVPGTITGDAVSPFQVGIIRNSSHVTFF